MSNRYADDIRRIVGTDEVQDGLSSAPTKPPLGGRRGIGYFIDETKPAGVSGKPNETLAPDENKANTKDGQDLPDDGVLVDPNDPTSGIFTPETGEYEASDILNETEGEGFGPTLIDDEKLLDITKGTLTQLNATDCASEKAIKMRTDGEFVPPDATFDEAGNMLTQAWTDPGIPPEKVGYVEGDYWQTHGAPGGTLITQSPIPYDSMNIGLAGFNAFTQEELGEDADSPVAGSYRIIDINPITSIRYDPEFEHDKFGGGTRTFNLTTTSVDCISGPPQEGATCPVEAPVETQWPTQEEFQLTYNNGIFEASIFDKNTPNNFIQDRSTIPFCYEDEGTKNGEMSVLANGAFAVYRTDGANGAILGTVRIYNGQGQAIAYTDASGYHSYLGKLPKTGI